MRFSTVVAFLALLLTTLATLTLTAPAPASNPGADSLAPSPDHDFEFDPDLDLNVDLASNTTVHQTCTTLPCQTDTLLFNTPLADFLSARTAKQPSTLDWTSDGCTHAPDHPKGYNFLDGCRRHDFGYRNYKHQHRFNKQTRAKLDANLRRDLSRECARYHGWRQAWKAVRCQWLVKLYYDAVREFGGRAKR